MVSLGGAWHSEEEDEETLLTNPKSRPDRRETELGVWSCHREEESEETMATRLKIWAQSRPSSVSRRSRLDFGWVNRVSSSSFPECHAPPNDTVMRWPVSSESLFSPPNKRLPFRMGIADRGPPGLQLPSPPVIPAPQVIPSESSLVTLLVILVARVTLVTLRAPSIRVLLGGIEGQALAPQIYLN